MTILGIDFSLKSTAAVLLNQGTYQFYTFARESVVKDDVAISLQESGVSINLTEDEPPLPKKATIAERERSSLEDAKRIIPRITVSFDTVDLAAYAIEGFSFGSNGNRLAQISGYQWVLRWQFSIIHPTTKMYIFSPMTVKSTAGKGNFNKDKMIEAFIQSEDPLLADCPFWQAMVETPESFQNKKGGWLKPIDDLIDAYWVVKTLEKTLATV